MELDLLAVAPHPDDAEFFCGGLLALSVDRGYRVGILDLSEGEMASQGSVALRQQESSAATATLGLTARVNAGLPDGNIGGGRAGGPLASRELQLARVVAAFRSLRPKVLVLPYWADRHPDHPASSTLCDDAIFLGGARNYLFDHSAIAAQPLQLTTAASPAARVALEVESRPFAPTQVIYYPFRREFHPSFVVNISSAVEKKYKAVSCFASQIVRQSALTEKDGMAPLASSPLMVSSLQSRDGYYGAMIGVAAGEAYISRAAVHIPDPIAHAVNNPLSNVLLFPE